MKKPATLTIADEAGEVVYMRFMDVGDIDGLIDVLDKFNDDFLQVITSDGEEFFTASEYITKLLEDA